MTAAFPFCLQSISLSLEVVLLNWGQNFLLDSKGIFNNQNANVCHLYQVCVNTMTLQDAVRTFYNLHIFLLI